MVIGIEEHLDNLVRHIELVREACLILGKRLIRQGRREFGRILIARGFEHDVSKFYGIEWDYLHAGAEVPKEELELAIRQHVRTNVHHPEYWGGVENMPEIAVAEMVCDWYARGQEFGTGLRAWITEQAIGRYQIDSQGEQYRWIKGFVDLLLENQFRR
jgi:hypothetical protein